MWYKYTIKIKLSKKGGVFVDEEFLKDAKTILIVDDEQPIVDILVYNLRKEGYNTILPSKQGGHFNSGPFTKIFGQ